MRKRWSQHVAAWKEDKVLGCMDNKTNLGRVQQSRSGITLELGHHQKEDIQKAISQNRQ